MDLFLRQRVLSTREENEIWDATGQPVYRLVGRLFNAGSKISLLDAKGRELYYVEERFFSILALFTLYQDGQECGRVRQKLSLLRPKLQTEEMGQVCIGGNIWGNEMELCQGESSFATLQKEWREVALFHLSVEEESMAPLALALTVAIDRFIHGGGG